MHSQRQAQRLRGQVPAGASAEAAEVSSRAAVQESSRERGQGGLFGAFCDRLICSCFNGLRDPGVKDSATTGRRQPLPLDSRSFLSRCSQQLRGCGSSASSFLSVGNDGSQGGFHIFARLIRLQGRGLRNIRCFGCELFSLRSFRLSR